MSTISVDYDVLNQRGSPAWFTDTFANIPTAGYVGRMFISKDTFAFYRDTGTGWDLIGGPGIGTLTGSGVAGQVSFFNGTQVLAGNNNLFWDNTNSRLGINTTTPGQPLDIHSTGNTLVQLNNTTTANSNISFQNQNVAKWRVGNVYNAGANSFNIENAGLLTNALTISSTTNNITLTGNVTASTYYSSAGIFLSTGGQASAGGGYATINGGTNYLDFRPANGGIFLFSFPYNTTRTFTLPDTTGTIALTSNLSSYVPYTGATTNVNLGVNDFTSRYVNSQFAFIQGDGTMGGVLGFTQYATSYTSTSNCTDIYALGNNKINFSFYQIGGAFKIFNFDVSSLDTTNTRAYTLPNATGTLALTSDITSAISGTTNRLAKFTSANVIGNSGVSDDGTTLIYSSSGKASLQLKATNNTYYGQLAFTNGTNGLYGGISYNNSGQYMQFEANTSEYMRLNSNGNFLIGTTTDNGNNLQVNGTGYFGGNLGIGTSSPTAYGTKNLEVNGSGSAYLTVKGSSNAVIGELAADGEIYLSSKTANAIIIRTTDTERMRITSTGQVYMGVASNPAGGRLAIDGTGLVIYSGGQYRQLTQSGNTLDFFNGSNSATLTSAGVWTDASDISIKKDILDIKYGLNEVMKLKPKCYKMIDDNLEQIGFIAQDVENVLPELVSTNQIGMKNLSYGQLTAVLTKAIQELNEKLVKNNIN